MNGKPKPHDAPPEVNLPITPMLDMAFQLLMFFLFTYNPSALEGQLDFALPQSRGEAPGIPDRPIADKDVDQPIPFDLNVRIHKRAAGYTLTVEEGPIRTPLDNLDALKKHLKNVFKDRAEAIRDRVKGLGDAERETVIKKELQRTVVKVQADADLKWTHAVEVMDVCKVVAVQAFKEANFDVKRLNVVNISFAAPPDRGNEQ